MESHESNMAIVVSSQTFSISCTSMFPMSEVEFQVIRVNVFAGFQKLCMAHDGHQVGGSAEIDAEWKICVD